MPALEPLVPIEPRKLTLIGYWLGWSELGWPDVRNSVDPSWHEDERQEVTAYLRKGTLFRSFMGHSVCRFCCIPNGASEQTDGSYFWPEGLAHYLEQHDVRLPDQFVEHARRGRKGRQQVRRRELKDATAYEAWWRGQTWQNGTPSFDNHHPTVFLELLRQELAEAKYLGGAEEVQIAVATGGSKAGELLLQAINEAQREHEARYGPPAPPLEPFDPATAVKIDMATGRPQRSAPASTRRSAPGYCGVLLPAAEGSLGLSPGRVSPSVWWRRAIRLLTSPSLMPR